MQSTNTHTNLRMEHIVLSKPSVLIVDDSSIMRKSMDRILCEEFNVVEASDGNEAWATLSTDHSIQVVITDLMMPDKNGFQLLREMRESIHERIRQIPVIVVTGHEDDERMRGRAMALGATDFISKPFDAIQIRARARSYAKHGDTVRKLEHTRRLLKEKSTIDTLTGLANPRYLEQHGPELLAFAARQGTDVAVLRLDIDKFDTLLKSKGKQIADKVEVNISKIINACVRKEDGVARIDPAKFAVVMPGADETVAQTIANRIHKMIHKAAYRLGETRFKMTASAGLVCNTKAQAAKFEDIVKLAEERLARAFKAGGNKFIVDDNGGATEAALPTSELPPDNMLTVDEALVLLKAKQTDKVRKQLKPLLAKLLPLLVYGNQQLTLELDDALAKLKGMLSRINTDML